ncbi:MAG: LuxR C-terminal-related transcriptional regulator [Anaerolineaceae bacterium]
MATKFYIPVFNPALLQRDHLLKQLDEGIQSGKSLILVCAPAGYGKTTLLSHWISTQKTSQFRFTWLSLETSENDLVNFFTAIAASLEKVLPGISTLIENLFSAPQLPSAENIAATFLQRLGNLQQSLVFVLDDYQVISNKEIHAATMFVVEHMPANFFLVLSTRSDPPLALHRLRVRGKLVEIRMHELQFKREEVRAFLQAASTLNLQEEEIGILEDTTEGWAAGLRMALLSLQGKNNPASYIHNLSGRHHYIMDYLTEEVLNALSPEKQLFLIQTAILDRLCASLCNAVTGQQNGQQMLDELNFANCFLIELDEERTWFRYHHLFSDLLRVRLKQHAQGSPDLLTQLHQKAANWFEQNGFYENALTHSLHALDYEKAARIVEKSTLELFACGQLHALISWINILPEEIVNQRPFLNICQAWSFAFAGRLKEATAYIQRAKAILEQQDFLPSENVALRAEIQGIQSLIAVTSGNLQSALALIDFPEDAVPVSSAFARSVHRWAVGFAYRIKGGLLGAKKCFEEVLALGEKLNNPWTIVTASTDLGTVLRQLGQLEQSESVYRAGLSHFQFSETIPGYVGRLEAFLAMLLFERRKLEQADHFIDQAILHNQLWENPNHCAYAWMVKSRFSLQKRKYLDAAKELEKSDSWVQKGSVVPNLVALIESTRVRFFLQSGELEKALIWLNNHEFNPLPENATVHEVEEILRLSAARILLASRDQQTAAVLITPVETTARKGYRISTLIETLILKSLILVEPDLKMKSLREALNLGLERGYRQTFLDEGSDLIPLLQNCMDIPGVSDLIAILRQETPDQTRESVLTERELEILRWMAAGLSNPEIGKQLFISAGTVKAHSTTIYRKLNVSNRAEAISYAKDMGYL